MAKILTTKKFLLQIERARLEADLKSMKSTSQKTADSTLDNKIPDLEKVHCRSEAVPYICIVCMATDVFGRCIDPFFVQW